MPITPDSLLPPEAYARIRHAERTAAIAHRRTRTVTLGEHMTLQFEDERTVRRQIQELLHAGRGRDARALQAEIAAYSPLVPDGSNWKATLLLDYPDPDERQRALVRLLGVERHMYVAVEGRPRLYAIADEDLDRSDCGGRTCSVHFLRFEWPTAGRLAVRAGAAVVLGCDHPHCVLEVAIGPATLASLAGDLVA
ncbi:DUF3501 family protein [Ideonella sp.]|uniref:DUF3501 family protein n=1 Tax=Ideonella sp. TaxID=1929293 RepID=UPI0035B3570D